MRCDIRLVLCRSSVSRLAAPMHHVYREVRDMRRSDRNIYSPPEISWDGDLRVLTEGQGHSNALDGNFHVGPGVTPSFLSSTGGGGTNGGGGTPGGGGGTPGGGGGTPGGGGGTPGG